MTQGVENSLHTMNISLYISISCTDLLLLLASVVLPCPEGGAGDDLRLRVVDGAGEVVLEVHGRLDVLGELDHHDVGQRVGGLLVIIGGLVGHKTRRKTHKLVTLRQLLQQKGQGES